MKNINEATTMFRYIIPQLLELDWDFEDIEIGRNYHDIKISNGNFIIEAKKFGCLVKTQNKPYRFGVPQLQEYIRKSGLTAGCLTDGESWYWVEAKEIHKINDLQELSKSSIWANRGIYQAKEIEVTIENWPLDGSKRSVKKTVPIGHILSKNEIKAVL